MNRKAVTSWLARLWPVVGDYVALLAVLAGLVAIFSLTTRHFFSRFTFLTLANQIPDAVLLASGMTFVLIVGGIDLSVGSVLALSSAVLGSCIVRAHVPLGLALAACLAVGLACGAINGLVVVAWRLPAFIVTLGMLEMARGATYLVTRMDTLHVRGSIRVITDAAVFGLSAAFLLSVGVVVVGQVVLSHTAFGRHVFAVGGNEEASRLSGIHTRRVKVAVFTLCGLLAAAAGAVFTARLRGSLPEAAVGYELEAIAAAVIGGTSLMGGRGSVVATFLGVLIMRVLGAGLTQLGAQEPTKRLITGGIIIAAVIADYYRHKLGRSQAT